MVMQIIKNPPSVHLAVFLLLIKQYECSLRTSCSADVPDLTVTITITTAPFLCLNT